MESVRCRDRLLTTGYRGGPTAGRRARSPGSAERKAERIGQPGDRILKETGLSTASLGFQLNTGNTMKYIELVAVIAVLQFFFFGFMTGRSRRLSGLKAPAISGHEGFERMYRVQTNTLETLVAFLPALFIAGKYWPSILIASIGVIYVVGRFIYWRSYIAEPSKRGIGFMLSMLPTFALSGLALTGIVLSLFGLKD